MVDLNEVDFFDEKKEQPVKRDYPSYYIDGAGYLVPHEEDEAKQ